ncbi:hypothetical protein CYLTODRAFT_422385 [Cylindrobasidium torrendii FP15055 ss-10]|uniref:Uncharacterized protein n=1 Tax=Cylindrobasidium torrendii FP15055 ss-10 TaxID=1314674 RepID=A0A0D7BBN7_9AGAR|nr:hypothetical protein CYLTODRAFT_422385 [Cylindrobasidium torrendii FP15055 ss-10]
MSTVSSLYIPPRATLLILGEPAPKLLEPLLALCTERYARPILPTSSPHRYEGISPDRRLVLIRVPPKSTNTTPTAHAMSVLQRVALLSSALTSEHLENECPVQFGNFTELVSETFGYSSPGPTPAERLPPPTEDLPIRAFTTVIHFAASIKDAIVVTSVAGMYLEDSMRGEIIHVPLAPMDDLDDYIQTSLVNTKVVWLEPRVSKAQVALQDLITNTEDIQNEIVPIVFTPFIHERPSRVCLIDSEAASSPRTSIAPSPAQKLSLKDRFQSLRRASLSTRPKSRRRWSFFSPPPDPPSIVVTAANSKAREADEDVNLDAVVPTIAESQKEYEQLGRSKKVGRVLRRAVSRLSLSQ